MDTTGFDSLKRNRVGSLATGDKPEYYAMIKLRDVADEIVKSRGYDTKYSLGIFERDGEYIYRLNFLVDQRSVDDNIGNTTMFNFDNMRNLDDYVKNEVDLLPDTIPLDNYDNVGYEIIVRESLATTLIYPKNDEQSGITFLVHAVQFWFKVMIHNKRNISKSPSHR